LVAALLRVAMVTAVLAESNGSLRSGLWLTSPAGWLPRTGISSGTLRSVIEYGLPLPFFDSRCIRIQGCYHVHPTHPTRLIPQPIQPPSISPTAVDYTTVVMNFLRHCRPRDWQTSDFGEKVISFRIQRLTGNRSVLLQSSANRINSYADEPVQFPRHEIGLDNNATFYHVRTSRGCIKTCLRKGVLLSVSCPQTACDWTTGRKRSHSNSNQLTDKWCAGVAALIIW